MLICPPERWGLHTALLPASPTYSQGARKGGRPAPPLVQGLPLRAAQLHPAPFGHSNYFPLPSRWFCWTQALRRAAAIILPLSSVVGCCFWQLWEHGERPGLKSAYSLPLRSHSWSSWLTFSTDLQTSQEWKYLHNDLSFQTVLKWSFVVSTCVYAAALKGDSVMQLGLAVRHRHLKWFCWLGYLFSHDAMFLWRTSQRDWYLLDSWRSKGKGLPKLNWLLLPHKSKWCPVI